MSGGKFMLENAWGLAGIIMTIIFFIFGLIFAIMKEKGARLIAGYNFKPKEQSKKYDEKQMSKDMRNTFFIYSLIFLIGTAATYIWGKIWFWISFTIWLIYFLKNFHYDDDKAFGKYRKRN